MNNQNLYSLSILQMYQHKTLKKRFLMTFISETEVLIKNLYNEFENNNIKHIAFLSHNLKTNLKLFQVRELYDTVELLEFCIKTLKKTEIEELINKINTVFSLIKKDIENKIQNGLIQ